MLFSESNPLNRICVSLGLNIALAAFHSLPKRIETLDVTGRGRGLSREDVAWHSTAQQSWAYIYDDGQGSKHPSSREASVECNVPQTPLQPRGLSSTLEFN
jgi:hypothetical protein